MDLFVRPSHCLRATMLYGFAKKSRRRGQQNHSFTFVNQWIGDTLKKPTKIPFHRPMRNLTKTRGQALATKTDRSENIGHLSCPDRKLES